MHHSSGSLGVKDVVFPFQDRGLQLHTVNELSQKDVSCFPGSGFKQGNETAGGRPCGRKVAGAGPQML